MSNHEKAKKLYEMCNTDPKISTLMPLQALNGRGSVYYGLVAGLLINHYALNRYNSEFIPVTKDTFNINVWDKEGWKNIKKSLYKLQKKKLIEMVDDGAEKSVRIIDDVFYNPEVYKR
ncbi:hypothetical protein COI53_27520 [Bacillus thuringiensis]|nr:hypothetical protein [Bacillus thuringiensis]PFI26430.1 hypothetical protein COI53_27520 [Bacillus thuringiensis]PGQ51221.1 hypothetical protein COA16_30045 [Bacillus thuringiensis]